MLFFSTCPPFFGGKVSDLDFKRMFPEPLTLIGLGPKGYCCNYWQARPIVAELGPSSKPSALPRLAARRVEVRPNPNAAEQIAQNGGDN